MLIMMQCKEDILVKKGLTHSRYALKNDIEALPKECHLLSADCLSVYCASAKQIPSILLEIGYLRDVAFRHIKGESGSCLDLDRYDQDYSHLFVWNHHSQEVVSAYRLGFTDTILNTKGPSGLYLTSLFEISKQFFEILGPAIELGRTFVRPQYQKNFSSLLLLLRGIGVLVDKNPQYRYLFGLISISKSFSLQSRQIIAAFFKIKMNFPALSPYAYPRHSADLLLGSNHETLLNGITDLNDLKLAVNNLEGGVLSLPVLLKKYLKFNTRCVTYGNDPNFGDCLDFLCVTDLATTDTRILERYLGLKR